MSFTTKVIPVLAVSLLANLTSTLAQDRSGSNAVSVERTGNTVRVEMGGELFTEYHFENVSRPFLYPVIGPGGARMTRDYPMQVGENDAKDHPHQRSLWYAHGAINGHDFWSEGSRAGKTVHEEFLRLESGRRAGVIQTKNRLVANDGTVVCTDERTMTFRRRGTNKIIDFEITIHASNGEIVFGDTKEGTMAIRLAPTMRLKGTVGQGHIINSEGVKDGGTWGKRAAWCDYYGPVQGKTVGVAIFDHPQNPRHPTWWHVRDYGLFGANPFGIHDFERKPAGAGDMKVAAGESVTFRYRFLFHEGNAEEANVADQYRAYVERSSRN